MPDPKTPNEDYLDESSDELFLLPEELEELENLEDDIYDEDDEEDDF